MVKGNDFIRVEKEKDRALVPKSWKSNVLCKKNSCLPSHQLSLLKWQSLAKADAQGREQCRVGTGKRQNQDLHHGSMFTILSILPSFPSLFEQEQHSPEI